MLGEGGGMFSPFNSQVGLVYWPNEEGSYIKTFSLDISDPKSWETVKEYILSEQSKELRLTRIIENLTEKYPCLKGARGIDLIVRPTLSYSEDLAQRPHEMVQIWSDGHWIKAQSLKATFAPLTALQVIYWTLKNAENLGITKEFLSIETFHAMTWLELMYKWMSHWELPPNEVPQGVILPDIFYLIYFA
ncbi:hypothetical protein [Candidatus Paracaedibacter symbiosus]|uniref:hypothetical protein n=1 Tax=Candidatus Paracaedibacter symbiosus TaxID=244582 RepID=UPI001E521293|nr:hypothetical protein [Candidatus Paracaedibacter symbiosus]